MADFTLTITDDLDVSSEDIKSTQRVTNFDEISLDDSIRFVKINTMLITSEILTLNDSLNFNQKFSLYISDNMVLNSNSELFTKKYLTIRDDLILNDDFNTNYNKTFISEDNLELLDSVLFRLYNNGVEVNYKDIDSWVLNKETNAMWLYSNYNFNSFMKIGDKYFGGNENGLYDLTTKSNADDDFKYIPVKLVTGMIDVGAGAMSTVTNMFLNSKNNGPITVTIGGSDSQSYSYDYSHDSRINTNKDIYFGLGRYQSYYQFTIDNASLTDFTLYDFKLLSQTGTRMS